MDDERRKILVIHYCQSGQLTRIVESFLRPLMADPGYEVNWEILEPVKPYPYPWPFFRFLDVFPECIGMVPPAIKPVKFDVENRYDLIILSYQVWFLSPSLPVTGFLKSEAAAVMRDTPVITVIGCRDMWLMAQEKVKQRLNELGARLIDNVVFTDQGKKIFTFITTPRWLIWGKKKGFWKVFPPAGVSEQDIEQASRFGQAIANAFMSGAVQGGRSLLQGLGAVKVEPKNIRMEKIAHRDFRFWGWMLRCLGRPGQKRRYPLLLLFVGFLATVVVLSLPFGALLDLIVNRFRKEATAKDVAYYEMPSGSSRHLMTIDG